jgi:transposase
MQDGESKTDKKDAYSIFDLLQQGKFFLPVERDDELNSAYRLMRRHMGLKKRVSQIRNQLRGAIHLAFPELNDCINDITQPTSLRFLQSNPTPESVMRNGRKRFLEKWRPRCRCGQWRPKKFEKIYDLAKLSIGLKDPYRTDEFEIKTLAKDLADALEKQQMWLDKAIEFLEERSDFRLLMSMPRVGKPTAVAILTAIGNINEYTNGKQLVKLAGLDVRLYESGSSILKRPRISRVGSAYLRHWVYYLSMRLVAHEPKFKEYFQLCKKKSPGKGAGIRALTSVCDKLLRIIYRMLKNNEKYLPGKDKIIEEYYIQQRKAA